MIKKKCIAYIGEFDLRNQNVQSHLVLNNGKVFELLGYEMAYVGVNRKYSKYDEVEKLPCFLEVNNYLELPNTLNMKGILLYKKTCDMVIAYLEKIFKENKLEYVITYQSPTFSGILKKIAVWCKKNNVKYIVNCADLPIFGLQSFIKKSVMKWNWNEIYKINKKYADGFIVVSSYIEKFYKTSKSKTIIVPPLFDYEKIEKCNYKKTKEATFIYAGQPFVKITHEADPSGMKDRLDKIIDLFILASKKNINYKFIIVGLSKEEYLTCVPRQKKYLEYEDKILFIGKISHEETLRMVAQSDYSINFRDKNLMTEAGFSTKVVESISLGTPVVINEISDTFNYLKENYTGYKLGEDINDNLKKISTLCNIPLDERIKNKKNCFEERVFDYHKYKDDIDKFLKELERSIL